MMTTAICYNCQRDISHIKIRRVDELHIVIKCDSCDSLRIEHRLE